MKIGHRKIGQGHPVFIVAELSGNHGGELEYALALVRAAASAGADAIKLQTYTADTITLKCKKPDFRIRSDSPWKDHGYLYELYENAFTPWEWQGKLFSEAKKLGLEAFSSPPPQAVTTRPSDAAAMPTNKRLDNDELMD